MRALTILAMLAAASTDATAADAPRFSGDGALVEGMAESADGRFALQAGIEAGDDDTQRGGRYSLDARLAVGDLAKSSMGACTTAGDIFKNSFE